MAPNTFKLQSLNSFETLDKALFTRKRTPLLSDEEARVTKATTKLSDANPIVHKVEKSELKQTELAENTKNDASNEYWDWCNDETVSERKARENKKLLEKILQEEETRIFFSGDEVVRREEQAVSYKSEQYQTESNVKVNSEYWTWESDQDTNRRNFSVESRVKQLVSESKIRNESDVEHICSRGNQNHFWDWRNDETETERRQKENKETLANLLHEENIRKEFLVQAIQDRLKLETFPTPSISAGVNESANDYWSW